MAIKILYNKNNHNFNIAKVTIEKSETLARKNYKQYIIFILEDVLASYNRASIAWSTLVILYLNKYY